MQPLILAISKRSGAAIRDVLRSAFAHKRNIVAVVVGQVVAMLGVAAGTRVLTEMASPAAYGEARLVLGLIALAGGLFFRPLTQYVMRGYHDAQVIGRAADFTAFARRSLLKVVALLGLLLVLGLGFYQAASGRFNPWLALAAGGYLIGGALWELEAALLLTSNRQVAASVLRSLEMWGLPLAAAAGLLWLGDSATSLLLFQAVALGVGMLLLRWRLHLGSARPAAERATAPEAQWILEAKDFVRPLLGLGLFAWIINVGDRYLLAHYFGAAVVGQYAAVYGLFSAPLLVAGSMLTRLLYPLWFKAAAQARPGAEQRLFRSMLAVLVMVVVTAIAVVSLFGKPIIDLLLAENYRPGAPALAIWIAAGYGALVIAYAFDMRAYASKRTRVMTAAYGLAALVNLGLNLLWIPTLGALGAARATFAGCVVYLAAMLIFTWRAGRRATPGARVETHGE